jgi:hypothetical protein
LASPLVGRHHSEHAMTSTDPIPLSSIDNQLASALPVSYGLNNPLITWESLETNNPFMDLVYVSAETLKPENNIHYVVSNDLVLQNPTIVAGQLWHASMLVQGGVLLTMPATWTTSGTISSTAATLVFLSLADSTHVYARMVPCPNSYTAPSATQHVYVATDGSDANDGLSWGTPKLTVDAGATLARSLGRDLWLKTGTYSAASDLGFELGGITTYGGFAGTETSVAERSRFIDLSGRGAGTYANATVLQNRVADRATAISIATVSTAGILYGITLRDSKIAVRDGATLIDCLITSNTNANGHAPLSHCVLWGCTVTANGAQYGGGCHYCIAHNCQITYNTVTNGYGGGIYAGVYTDCLIDHNTAASSQRGGGAYGGVFVTCTISYNSGAYGGGVYGDVTFPVKMIDCILNNNNAFSYRGGGAYCNDTTSCIGLRCTFDTNTANYNPSGYGGGASGGTWTDCIFKYNTSYQNGGGTIDATTISCIFLANDCLYTNGSPGGAISGGTCINCVIARHGWMSHQLTAINANSIVINCTIIHNNTISLSANVKNCVLWRNTTYSSTGQLSTIKESADGLVIASFTAALDVVANVPVGNVAAFDAAVLAHGYDLAAGAIAIDVGNNSYNTTTVDLLGRPRNVGTIDCGAYEHQ